MATIRIVQIFQNVDLRKGEDALRDMTAYGMTRLEVGEVMLFINKRRNIVKIVGQHGMLTEKLPKEQTWDLSLRKEQIMGIIGKSFGIAWGFSPSALVKARKQLSK